MMKRVINLRFILTATLTYIPYTVLWFFWHNNIFRSIYYSANSLNLINSVSSQNIWAMNFANALLVYGFVYFYFRSNPHLRKESFGQSPQPSAERAGSGQAKQGTELTKSVLWGVYYNISVIGFYSFLNFGMLREWSPGVLIHDMIFAVIGGVVSGVLVHFLNNKFTF